MSDEIVDTGFNLMTPQPSPEVAASAPVETAIPVETAPSVPVPHPDGPTVAELLAAKAPEQTDAEKAFAEPIKILDPAEHFAPAHVIVGNDPNQVANQTVQELRALQESPVAARNREIYEKILAARNQPPAVPVQQPVAKRITEQTKLEMAEGARISSIHAERQATIKRPVPSQREIAAQGTSIPVFRPDDYVPGLNQGNVRVHPVI